MNEIVLACDLGGTNLRMAAVNSSGEILYRTKGATPQGERADAALRAIVEAAGECIAAVKNIGTVSAIAAAMPGTVNVEKGIVLNAPNVPALDGFRIVAALEEELSIRALLENDANAAAVGENWLGASKGFQNSIMVTLGTGVGGGVIINGLILRGPDGTAGEIGHVPVEPFGEPCGCGSRGCLEQYSSASAIVRFVEKFAGRYKKSRLPLHLPLTAKDVYEAGLGGDELALEVFRQQGFYLGVALSGLINVLNPEVVVIGGGGAAGWDLFVPHLKEQIRNRTWAEPGARAQLEKARLGDDAGILGAARQAFELAAGESVKASETT